MRRRTLHFDSRKNDQIRHGGPGMEDALETFLADLKAVSKESGISCSTLCISWILSHSAVSTVLAGCRTTAQLEANVKAVETTLSADLVKRLDETAPRLPACAEQTATCGSGTAASGKGLHRKKDMHGAYQPENEKACPGDGSASSGYRLEAG